MKYLNAANNWHIVLLSIFPPKVVGSKNSSWEQNSTQIKMEDHTHNYMVVVKYISLSSSKID